jgi:hypothetical protein
MKMATIDDQQRAQLPGAVPKEKFWIIQDAFGYRLQRIPQQDNGTRMRREEVLNAIRSSKLTFTRDWEEIRQETREP